MTDTAREWIESSERESLICCIYPCGSTMHVRTAEDLNAMELFMLQREPFLKGPMVGGSQESQLTVGVIEAKKNNATHLAVIEHDMRFPKDAFVRLRAHGKPIIGANYRERNRRTFTTIQDGKKIHSRGKTGIEPVTSIGLGVTLIDMRVFDAIPQPWFVKPWVHEAQRHFSVDVWFSRIATANGFQPWVDHSLSAEVAHICGSMEMFPDRLVFTETQEKFCDIPEGFDDPA